MSVKKIAGSWRRKQAKRVAKTAKSPLFRYQVAKGMDNVRGGPKYSLGNRSYTRRMSQRSNRKNKKA